MDIDLLYTKLTVAESKLEMATTEIDRLNEELKRVNVELEYYRELFSLIKSPI